MTQDPQLYFPSKGSHTQDFYALKNQSNPQTSDPEASMITTGPPGSKLRFHTWNIKTLAEMRRLRKDRTEWRKWIERGYPNASKGKIRRRRMGETNKDLPRLHFVHHKTHMEWRDRTRDHSGGR